jgi:hypothetical protein
MPLSNQIRELTPDYIAGVRAAFTYVKTAYLMGELYPDHAIPGRYAKVHFVRPKKHGLARPALMSEVAPQIDAGGWKEREYKTGFFLEKVVYTPDELLHIREPGTFSGVRAGRGIIEEDIAWMEERHLDRLEQLKFMATRGLITVSERGINWTARFPRPASMSYVAPVEWTDTTNATPLVDLRVMLGRALHTGGYLGTIYGNYNTLSIGLETDQFKDLLYNTASNYFEGQIADRVKRDPFKSPQQLETMNNLIKRLLLGRTQFAEWNEGYRIEVTTTSQITAASDTVTVDDPSLLEAGMEMTLEGWDTDLEETVEIDSISGKTVTFTSNVVNTYGPGSYLTRFQTHLADGELLLIPEPRPDSNEKPKPLGETFQSTHPYGNGASLLSPKTGIGMEIQQHENENPKRLEIVSAACYMPALERLDGPGTLTVYTP